MYHRLVGCSRWVHTPQLTNYKSPQLQLFCSFQEVVDVQRALAMFLTGGMSELAFALFIIDLNARVW